VPTRHGFDELFGNLYHLNAEEEPENPDYPKDPNFRKRLARAVQPTSKTPQESAWR
jgi:arylsulfatase A-like enzyme